MKKYRLITGLASVFGFGLALNVTSFVLAADENGAGKASSAPRRLTNAQLEAIVKPGLHTCQAASSYAPPNGRIPLGPDGRVQSNRINPDSIISAEDAIEVSLDRVGRTLHGIWKGTVEGDHGEVNVDYFWIIDVEHQEGLILAQRTGVQTLAKTFPVSNAPQFSFLMCGHDGYVPEVAVPQMHVFTKISDDTSGAAKLVESATGGVKSTKINPSLTDLWDALVESQYFYSLNKVAVGGGLFKPLTVSSAIGANGVEETVLSWDARYRGGGDTLLEFTENVEMIGFENGQFTSTSTASGDYLVASPGNGKLWKVEVFESGEYSLAFDAATIGPLVAE